MYLLYEYINILIGYCLIYKYINVVFFLLLLLSDHSIFLVYQYTSISVN